MGPDQSIYNHLNDICTNLGYTTYPTNPGTGARYPYVQLGPVQVLPKATKSYLLGAVVMTLDVWGDVANRWVVSEMANAILEELGKNRKTYEGYDLHIQYDASTIDVLVDQSTSTDLWRANMALRINFN